MNTVILLIISNIFMTYAWYGHLKNVNSPLFMTIMLSWGVAFFEYVFQVPANRLGAAQFSTVQLKAIQEAVSLTVFCGFVVIYMKESLRWNHVMGFALMVVAVALVFKK